MAFEQFAQIQRGEVFQTNGLIKMGSRQFARNGEAGYWYVKLFIKNSVVNITTERVRIKVFSDSKYRNILYTSNWSDLINITNLNPLKDWVGWIRTDFNLENINKEATYYLACEISNYTYLEPYHISLLKLEGGSLNFACKTFNLEEFNIDE